MPIQTPEPAHPKISVSNGQDPKQNEQEVDLNKLSPEELANVEFCIVEGEKDKKRGTGFSLCSKKKRT